MRNERFAQRTVGSVAGDALVRIGKQGSKAAVIALRDKGSERRASLLVAVIVAVEGKEVGKYMVEIALKKEETEEGKANLRKALDILATKEWPPSR